MQNLCSYNYFVTSWSILSEDFSITDLVVTLQRERLRKKNKKNQVCTLVYMPVILALTLLVAIATIKRAFLATSIVKNWLQNRTDN